MLQSITSITSELWPSVSSALAAPLRGGTQQKFSRQTAVPRQQAARYSTTPESVAVESRQPVSGPNDYKSLEG
jgi:hypothetical protein